MEPKVFISYSWSSAAHQSLVRHWADDLIADGIEVVVDMYDLKEGDDKFAYMERMVTDKNVTHVLVVCDKIYSEKADGRKAGVGTETQIISKEIYEKVEQSKFIPVVCEFDEDNVACVPTFLRSRIWIDFSSPEAVNENWERLIRLLYGKPEHQKPTLGKPPAYVLSDAGLPSSPAVTKLNTFRQALLQNRTGLPIYRRAFLSACISYIESIRVRERPTVNSLGQQILEDCGKLKHVRNDIIDWVLLESEASPSREFSESLLTFLEELLTATSTPHDSNSWNNTWTEAYRLFLYETFLYVVAALLKTNAFETLHEVLTGHYLVPEAERRGDNQFASISIFYRQSDALQSELAPKDKRLHSPAAELVKRQADRGDLPFTAVIEADLLVLLLAFTNANISWWYPQMLHYAPYRGEFPFFVRSTSHRHFLKLATITRISNADDLRNSVKEGHQRLGVNRWTNFYFSDGFWSSMNLDKLDSLK